MGTIQSVTMGVTHTYSMTVEGRTCGAIDEGGDGSLDTFYLNGEEKPSTVSTAIRAAATEMVRRFRDDLPSQLRRIAERVRAGGLSLIPQDQLCDSIPIKDRALLLEAASGTVDAMVKTQDFGDDRVVDMVSTKLPNGIPVVIIGSYEMDIVSGEDNLCPIGVQAPAFNLRVLRDFSVVAYQKPYWQTEAGHARLRRLFAEFGLTIDQIVVSLLQDNVMKNIIIVIDGVRKKTDGSKVDFELMVPNGSLEDVRRELASEYKPRSL